MRSKWWSQTVSMILLVLEIFTKCYCTIPMKTFFSKNDRFKNLFVRLYRKDTTGSEWFFLYWISHFWYQLYGMIKYWDKKKKTPVHLLVSKFILFFNAKSCTFHCKQSCRSKHLLKQFWRRNVMKIMHSEHYILIYWQIIFTAKLKNCFQDKVTIKILPHRLTIKSYLGRIEVHPIDKAEELIKMFLIS